MKHRAPKRCGWGAGRFWLLVGCLALSLLAAPIASADPFQREFRFHNELGHTIYPVIQAPTDSNCGPNNGSQRRIFVNAGARGSGIPHGASATVRIPKDRPCASGGFYDASRIYIMIAQPEAFEATFPAGDAKRTVSDPDWNPAWDAELCPANPSGCWAGIAGADYGHDAPGQLLEYTIISQDPTTGDKFPSANDTRGIPFLDFDVSYVDDAYLPVAMAIDDTGATQFMGSTIGHPTNTSPYTTFNNRLAAFLKDAQWSRYAAYSDLNWNATGGRNTVFRDLVPEPRMDRLPSANILITDARTGGTSSFFQPSWDGAYSRLCNAGPFGNQNTPNRQCQIALPTVTNCCPDNNGVMQGCCDVRPYLIDNTIGAYTGNDRKVQNETLRVYRNSTLEEMTKRWKSWVRPISQGFCQNAKTRPDAPVVDKQEFCEAFDKTVDYIWKEFTEKDRKGPQACSRINDPQRRDQCLVQQIIGYDIKSGYDPKLCGRCPTDCPPVCVEEIQRNESVQALQRGLPWTPAGDPKVCKSRCPGDQCPLECVAPITPHKDARLYHRNKFLHFWADPASIYNLNPFAWFVHDHARGLAAPGAYSFSIDDFYGNFGGQGSAIIINVGGISALPNKEPFDPFKQYAVGVAPGWVQGTVCGRPFTVPESIRGKVGLSVPFAFWKDGSPIASCEVVLVDRFNQHVKYLLNEVTYQVSDALTGRQETVSGLSGVWATRPSSQTAEDDAYCVANSTLALVSAGKCKANLAHKGGNQDYVGVSSDHCLEPLEARCGKPMIVLNPPATD
jgi:hypothetical protein